MDELLSALAESGAYSHDRDCLGMLVCAAAPYQAFRDSTTCLSRGTSSPKGTKLAQEAHGVDTIHN